MKLGILGTADIAFRRFLPALSKCPGITYAGVASRTPQKCQKFQEQYGGEVYDSYDALLEDESIDAVYVPLPPALHYEWGKKVLLAGKHLLMEKPFTTNPQHTKELLELAEKNGLAVHENYMFLYHSQLDWIRQQLQENRIGDLRLIRTAFGFPFRGNTDFRYDKELGGGALLDCGGYPIRLATELLGSTAAVTTAQLNCGRGLNVDVYGSASMVNDLGQVAQISFGMDNSYKCELELWGSTGCILADRIFTAPAGFTPSMRLKTQTGEEQVLLESDDSFLNSICTFYENVQNIDKRETMRNSIYLQSILVEKVKEGFTL